ncbi:MAG: chorismate synthase [Verrucomicrobiota bacterium]
MSNSFGRIFRVTTFGESHGPCIGAVIDGCPSRVEISEKRIQAQMARRRPGQSRLATSRSESDRVSIVSGMREGATLGTPIALIIENRDTRPSDYSVTQEAPRPSHADFTYRSKYGIVAASGGGRASARETACRVAAGSIAEQYIESLYGIEIIAWVSSIGDVSCEVDSTSLDRDMVDGSPVRCPDDKASSRMIEIVEEAIAEGDSVGGTVSCVCRKVPAGWGEPVFDKMHSRLAAAMVSIPAARGFEIGAGFASSRMKGSEHNDVFTMKSGRLGTATNHSGGVQGGITNGEPVVFRAAFKPTASIEKKQQSSDYKGNMRELELKGRHDPCIVPRAVPVVESMAALVLADMARMS